MLTPIVVSDVCFPFLRLEGHHMMWRHGGTWHGGVHQADKVAQQDIKDSHEFSTSSTARIHPNLLLWNFLLDDESSREADTFRTTSLEAVTIVRFLFEVTNTTSRAFNLLSVRLMIMIMMMLMMMIIIRSGRQVTRTWPRRDTSSSPLRGWPWQRAVFGIRLQTESRSRVTKTSQRLMTWAGCNTDL